MKTKGALPLTVPEIEKAKSLSALGRSYRAIGRELHRSPHAIKRVLTKSPEVVAQVEVIKRNLADTFEGLAERMVGSITDEDIIKLSAYQRTLSGAIAVDKMQLLRGEPTAILGLEILFDVASMIRREEDDIPQPQRTLHAAPEPEQPANPIPAPQPAKTQEPALTRVRYQAAKEIPVDSAEYNPLTHGLPTSR